MRKSLVAIGIFTILINFVSALTVNDFVQTINLELILFGVVFLIVLGIVNFSLSKSIFKTQKSISIIIAIIFATFAVYGLSKMNLSFDVFFFNLGLTEEMVAIALPGILLIAAVILFWIGGLGLTLLIFGLIMLLATIFGEVYQQEVGIILGGLLALIGAGLYRRRREKRKIRRRLEKAGPLDKAKYKNEVIDYRNKKRERRQRIFHKAINPIIPKSRRI